MESCFLIRWIRLLAMKATNDTRIKAYHSILVNWDPLVCVSTITAKGGQLGGNWGASLNAADCDFPIEI